MMRVPFELRRLTYFVAVCDHGGFRRAAETLHVSQPPLTRQIQLLEEEIGVELLARSARGVEPTPAGRSFLEHARRILALSREAAEDAVMTARGALGRLDVAVFGSATFRTAPRIVQEFRRQHPRVKVALHHLDRNAQLQALRAGVVDAGFNWFFPGDAEIERCVLMAEPMVVAMHQDHPFAARANVDIGDLHGAPLIVFPREGRPNFADHVLFVCRQAGAEPVVAEEVDDVVTAMAMVSCGFGLSVTVASVRDLAYPDVRFAPLRAGPEMNVELGLYYRRNDSSTLLNAFVRVAKQHCAGAVAISGS